MIALAGKRNLRACFVTAANMTRLFALLDFKRGVFICEVLDGVFSQPGPLFDNYKVPQGDANEQTDNIARNLRALMSDYKGDKSQLYDILEDVRGTATAFQSKCISTFPKTELISTGVDM